MHQRGVNTGQGTASGENVCHDGSGFRKLGGVADDRHAVADRAYHREGAIQQCLAGKIQECFICAHAGTLASGKEEAHARRCGSWHMEKHKAYTAMHESNLFRTAKPSEDEYARLVRGHYSSSCRKNSWMFSCWDAVRTSFPGRGARLTESTTKSAWCARPLTSTTGRPCVAEIGSTNRWRRPRRSGAAPAKSNRPGCPGRGVCGRTFRFDTAAKISVPGTRA